MTQALTSSLGETMQLGELLAASGFFQDSRGAAQAVVKVLAGREMGFGPIASMTGINVIQGRVSISASLMAAAIKRSGRYDYRVKEMTPARCEIEFRERNGDKWEVIGSSEFTAQDARQAGTKNMDKFARNMLFARAMSNGARWYCPDIFGGPVYTPEEMGATVDGETGEVIDVPAPRVVVEQPKPQPANGQPATAERTTASVAQSWQQEQRPWSPDNAIGALRYAAEHAKNEAPADGTWGALIGLLETAPFDTMARHTLLKAAFGVESSKDLTGKQRYALVKWSAVAKSGPEKSDPWVMDGNAIEEYRRIVGLDIAETDNVANDPDDWHEIDAAGVTTEAARF